MKKIKTLILSSLLLCLLAGCMSTEQKKQVIFRPGYPDKIVKEVTEVPTYAEIDPYKNDSDGDKPYAKVLLSSLNFQKSRKVAELLATRKQFVEISESLEYNLCVEAFNAERAHEIIGIPTKKVKDKKNHEWIIVVTYYDILPREIFEWAAQLASRKISVQLYVTARFLILVKPNEYDKARAILKNLADEGKIRLSDYYCTSDVEIDWENLPFAPSKPIFSKRKGKALWSSFPEGESPIDFDKKK